ncbi:hypothetical protein [Picosynechococcus sp. PCC 11901]|uniref:hypothetical protein n=2 Tax=Picosynechococcus TaxID=3079908 RepID=UPI0030DA514B
MNKIQLRVVKNRTFSSPLILKKFRVGNLYKHYSSMERILTMKPIKLLPVILASVATVGFGAVVSQPVIAQDADVEDLDIDGEEGSVDLDEFDTGEYGAVAATVAYADEISGDNGDATANNAFTAGVAFGETASTVSQILAFDIDEDEEGDAFDDAVIIQSIAFATENETEYEPQYYDYADQDNADFLDFVD